MRGREGEGEGEGRRWAAAAGGLALELASRAGAPGAVASCRSAVTSCGAARRQGACAVLATASSIASRLAVRELAELAGVARASECTASQQPATPGRE